MLVALFFILGWQLGHRDYSLSFDGVKPKINITNQTPPKEVNFDFKLFWDTYDLVSKKYIDKGSIDPQKLYYGAIQGMVAAIGDPYTTFLPPEQQRVAKEELGGSFEGVGLQLGYNKDKRLVVIAPLKGTPAEKAGVKPGDLILKINDKDTISLSLPEAVGLIRGSRGTTVKLTLFSNSGDKPKEITITRDTIIVKSVEFEIKKTPTGKNIAYIRLSRFGEKTKSEWEKAVSAVLDEEVDGVVLDVRNNPGGFLEGAVYIASEFFDSDKVVIKEDAKGERQTFSVSRSGRLTKTPLVVLVNRGSASASEIVAGAVQDRKRGKLVGETTFGKGSIQSAEDLPQGTGIHITTDKWLTPTGKSVTNTGLAPDIKIEEDDDQKKDAQLDKALETF